jgi:hypothetical protein
MARSWFVDEIDCMVSRTYWSMVGLCTPHYYTLHPCDAVDKSTIHINPPQLPSSQSAQAKPPSHPPHYQIPYPSKSSTKPPPSPPSPTPLPRPPSTLASPAPLLPAPQRQVLPMTFQLDPVLRQRACESPLDPLREAEMRG